MEKELRIIQHLYGEAADPEALRQAMAQDAALRSEYEALARVKAQLDRQAPQRPSPYVVDRIVEAAGRPAPADPPLAARQDRAAVPPSRIRTGRLFSLGGAALVVLLLIGIGVQQMLPAEAGLQSAVTEAIDEAPRGAASDARSAPATKQAPAAPSSSANSSSQREEGGAGQARGVQVPPPRTAAVPAEKLAWDDAESEVLRVHQRIQLLQARSASSRWGAPAEALQPRVQPASQW